jgi:hypothetical protein
MLFLVFIFVPSNCSNRYLPILGEKELAHSFFLSLWLLPNINSMAKLWITSTGLICLRLVAGSCDHNNETSVQLIWLSYLKELVHSFFLSLWLLPNINRMTKLRRITSTGFNSFRLVAGSCDHNNEILVILIWLSSLSQINCIWPYLSN